MSSFTVYPAIDVRAGRVVRLQQGDYARETRYADDPLGLGRAYLQQGAQWLHLVDLDAARSGGYGLLALLRGLADAGLQVQTGGGVRTRDDVVRLLEGGAARVVIGSLAIAEPDRVLGWLAEFGSERLTIALDARQDADGCWSLPTHGWTEGSGQTLQVLVRRYAAGGLQHLLCTDIGRDGMLAGPNLDLYRELRALEPGLQLQASGGARDLVDVAAAREAGCAGIVLGKALLDGRMTLAEALAC
ncbi:MAG: 1-(5-phosphoribosyl)-5-[(5-phosphoribosylamino)methylideneamino] imidazole-4-carboxamide isomerase [Pseudomonadota bacterium]